MYSSNRSILFVIAKRVLLNSDGLFGLRIRNMFYMDFINVMSSCFVYSCIVLLDQRFCVFNYRCSSLPATSVTARFVQPQSNYISIIFLSLLSTPMTALFWDSGDYSCGMDHITGSPNNSLRLSITVFPLVKIATRSPTFPVRYL